MRIYESLDLVGNYVSNAIVGTSGVATGGGIRYNSNKLQYHNGTTWIDCGGSSSETNYVSGSFTIGPGAASGTKITTGSFNVSAASGITGDPHTPTALKYAATSSGKLTIGTSGESTDHYIELDILGSISGGMVYYKEFTVTSAGTKYISLSNPFASSHIIVSIYESFTYKPTNDSSVTDREGWEKVTGEVRIKGTEDSFGIELQLSNVTSDSKFLVVITGAKNASEIPNFTTNDIKSASAISKQ